MVQRKPLIEGIGQFLDGVFPSCDLHNRHTGDLSDAADKFLIVRSHGVDAMFGYLYHISILTRLTCIRVTHPVHYAVICICATVATLKPCPSRILSHSQRQPVLRAQLFKFCNSAVCEAWDTLCV